MMAFSNSSISADLPPLPTYQLHPLPPLVPHIPDKLLTLLLPIAAYWIVSLFFHYLDTRDYLPQYRLHTPVEVLKRNRVSRTEVVREVIVQQIIQTVIGVLLGMTEPDDTFGKESYDVIVWARRIRQAQRSIPVILALAGIDAQGLAKNLLQLHPLIAGFLSGGQYSSLAHTMNANGINILPAFVTWEIFLAKMLYWFIVPACQFAVGVFVVDTWQYFLHRAMHMNQYLYRTFHARHHRLYVPYAFGALYNHPFEGFLLDTLGAAIAFKVAGMTTRQGMWFFTCSIIKTVDDHCGYALPWDPVQHLTSNNAAYHDIHHQSWGIKTNFSQPFFTVWDRLLGTVWTGGDVSTRYERSRKAAQKQLELDSQHAIDSKIALSEGKMPAPQAVNNEDQRISPEEADIGKQAPINIRSPGKRSSGTSTQHGSLKNLTDHVSGGLHRNGGIVLGVDRSPR